MKKWLISLCSLILVLVLLATPVFAGGNGANLPDDESELIGPVQEQGYLAKNGRLLKGPPIHYYESPVEVVETACSCGGTFRHKYTIHHPWEDFEYQHCINGANNHYDALMKQKVVVYYECDRCAALDKDYFYPLNAFCKG